MVFSSVTETAEKMTSVFHFKPTFFSLCGRSEVEEKIYWKIRNELIKTILVLLIINISEPTPNVKNVLSD